MSLQAPERFCAGQFLAPGCADAKFYGCGNGRFGPWSLLFQWSLLACKGSGGDLAPLGLVGVQASILLGVKSALVFNWVFVQFPPRRRVAFDPMFGVRIRSIAC